MTRWQRFKHAFVSCRGPVIRREYFPPREFEVSWFRGEEMVRLVKEATYGVTLLHCRCSTCGSDFTNRELGDAREADKPEDDKG